MRKRVVPVLGVVLITGKTLIFVTLKKFDLFDWTPVLMMVKLEAWSLLT